MRPLYLWTLAATLSLSLLARAETPTHLSVGLGGNTSTSDRAGGTLSLRAHFGDDLQLGLDAYGAQYDTAFISAYAVRDQLKLELSVPVMKRVYQEGIFRADAFVAPGVRLIQAPPGSSLGNSTAATLHAGLAFQFKLTDSFALRTGGLVPLVYELSPGTLLEKMGHMLHAGASWALTPNLVLAGQVYAGPLTGGNGDTAKYLAGANVGFRVHFGELSTPQLAFVP